MQQWVGAMDGKDTSDKLLVTWEGLISDQHLFRGQARARCILKSTYA